MYEFEKLQRDPISRRAFLARMGAAGLGVAAINLLSGCGGGGSGSSNNRFPGIPGSGDVQVLNYALALETLEADLYKQALSKASVGKEQNPTPTQETALDAFSSYTQKAAAGTFPGPGVDATTRGQVGYLYLKQFAFVEAAHRDFLRVAINAAGGTPLTRAQIAPKGFQFNASNNPGSTIAEILTAILPLEETGVRAYLGAVPSISNTGYLQVAGTIYSTEARHSAAVRYLLNQNSTGPGDFPGVASFGGSEVSNTFTPSGTSSTIGVQLFEKFLTPSAVLNAIKPLIAS